MQPLNHPSEKKHGMKVPGLRRDVAKKIETFHHEIHERLTNPVPMVLEEAPTRFEAKMNKEEGAAGNSQEKRKAEKKIKTETQRLGQGPEDA
ncbi:hypothetical protein Nepgr_032670 [Nepenthes gracilis]|uniref:Uncharacterized protein n=1 Tax=Nepenthes gracilis TaxID=150966 RepID=A0AAD3TLA1_NEPGR|nr:hypothetical protein Nepgr_032670 [Nepenthes gracilis]